MAPAELGTVIVTGGSSGLGDAVAHAVHDAGGVPVVLDLQPPANGFAAHLVDLADTRASEAAVDAVAREHGPVRGVVTAAGIDACGQLADVDAADWERVIAVNLLGTAAVATPRTGPENRGPPLRPRPPRRGGLARSTQLGCEAVGRALPGRAPRGRRPRPVAQRERPRRPSPTTLR